MSTTFMLVGGRFGNDGGQPSGYFKKLVEHFPPPLCYFNGGSLRSLEAAFNAIKSFDIVIWMPDVPNLVEKTVGDIKIKNPKKILVTSKRNLDHDDYTYSEVIARALAHKANLTVMFTGTRTRVVGTLLDPLGACFCEDEDDPAKLARAIISRATKLRTFTRMGSVAYFGCRPHPEMTDDLSDFFEYVKTCAKQFHEIIHGVNTERMLGNASFRCTGGFPSFRAGSDVVYVSRRNIDKREIDVSSFVPVFLDERFVNYLGKHKPSVDAPIQLKLYQLFPQINYMVHSHTYIGGARYTKEAIPCGAIEEVDAILDALPPGERLPMSTRIAVNLLGHGSIVMGKTVCDLYGTNWIPRPVPEVIPHPLPCTPRHGQLIEDRIQKWREEPGGRETEGTVELLCDAEEELRRLRPYEDRREP